jgi:hypothetical protein
MSITAWVTGPGVFFFGVRCGERREDRDETRNKTIESD